VVAGFEPSISGRFSTVHRGFWHAAADARRPVDEHQPKGFGTPLQMQDQLLPDVVVRRRRDQDRRTPSKRSGAFRLNASLCEQRYRGTARLGHGVDLDLALPDLLRGARSPETIDRRDAAEFLFFTFATSPPYR
jgi:hypothetical protein